MSVTKTKRSVRGEIVSEPHPDKGLRELREMLRGVDTEACAVARSHALVAYRYGEILVAIKRVTRGTKGLFGRTVEPCSIGPSTRAKYMRFFRACRDQNCARAILSIDDFLKNAANSGAKRNSHPKQLSQAGGKNDGSDLLANPPLESLDEAQKAIARIGNSNDSVRRNAAQRIAAADPGTALAAALESPLIECNLKPKHAKPLATIARTLDESKRVALIVDLMSDLSGPSKAKIAQRLFNGKKSDIPDELLQELSKRANLYLPKLGRVRKDKPESLDQVMEHAKHLVSSGERSDAVQFAKRFFEHYESSDWMIKDGVPVQDWKHRLKVYCRMVGGESTEDRRVDVQYTRSTSSIAERRRQIAAEKERKKTVQTQPDLGL